MKNLTLAFLVGIILGWALRSIWRTPTIFELKDAAGKPVTFISGDPLPTWVPLSGSGLIAGEPQNPTITTTSPLPQSHPNTDYTFSFTATGEPPIKWKAVGLPWWCTLSPSGVLHLWWPFWQTKPITITVISENKYGQEEMSFYVSLAPKDQP